MCCTVDCCCAWCEAGRERPELARIPRLDHATRRFYTELVCPDCAEQAFLRWTDTACVWPVGELLAAWNEWVTGEGARFLCAGSLRELEAALRLLLSAGGV